MKGIVLAGGSGSRLYPATAAASKQLLPVYNKPMVYYPLSVLMLAGIRDVLMITTEEDLPGFKKLLADGARFGVRLSYKIQPAPDGLAQAFILGEDFIAGDCCAMILGDNIFYGNNFKNILTEAAQNAENGAATIFGVRVADPERFGVAEFDSEGNVISIEEKPRSPKSAYCVAGLYFYDARAPRFAKELAPSARGELEITDLNLKYLENKSLKVKILGRGFAWFDAGTFESLSEASNFVSVLRKRQGIEIAALEEIAFYNGWITKERLLEAALEYKNSSYGEYLKSAAEGKFFL